MSCPNTDNCPWYIMNPPSLWDEEIFLIAVHWHTNYFSSLEYSVKMVILSHCSVLSHIAQYSHIHLARQQPHELHTHIGNRSTFRPLTLLSLVLAKSSVGAKANYIALLSRSLVWSLAHWIDYEDEMREGEFIGVTLRFHHLIAFFETRKTSNLNKYLECQKIEWRV